MKSVLLWFLVAVNVVLLGSLVGRFTHGDLAKAQIQAQRRVSDYLLVPAEEQTGQAGLVCIIDENTGQMAAVSYNGRNALDIMPTMDLERPNLPEPNGANGGQLYNNGLGGRRY
jgi:hypothetical protein